MMTEAEKTLRSSGIIAIARGIDPVFAEPLADALLAGGVRMLEITMNTTGAAEMIRTLRRKYEGRMQIGAGTVTDTARLSAAVEAGAQFIVTPNVNDEVIRRCIADDLLITPGALTPTEMCHAMELGCRYVKLFPSEPFGPAYLKAVRGPLSDLDILVVGGVNSANFEQYLKAGAFGAGVGGNLCRMRDLSDAEAITKEARALTKLRDQYIHP